MSKLQLYPVKTDSYLVFVNESNKQEGSDQERKTDTKYNKGLLNDSKYRYPMSVFTSTVVLCNLTKRTDSIYSQTCL